jgi:hypothetical protein
LFEPPELWLVLPLLVLPPLLCSVVGLWWVGFLVGFLVGLGVEGGGAGGGAGLVGATVAVGGLGALGVFCVGRAAAGEETTTASPEPAALCGHQATRQAARPSIAATATRTMFVPVLLTTTS